MKKIAIIGLMLIGGFLSAEPQNQIIDQTKIDSFTDRVQAIEQLLLTEAINQKDLFQELSNLFEGLNSKKLWQIKEELGVVQKKLMAQKESYEQTKLPIKKIKNDMQDAWDNSDKSKNVVNAKEQIAYLFDKCKIYEKLVKERIEQLSATNDRLAPLDMLE